MEEDLRQAVRLIQRVVHRLDTQPHPGNELASITLQGICTLLLNIGSRIDRL